MAIEGLGVAYIRPLRYFEQVEFFTNRPDSFRTLAALFRTTLVAPGFADCTAADARRIYPTVQHVLLRAIRAASGLDDDTADTGTDTDAEMTHADRIHALHDLGYEFPGLYGLLPQEIEAASEGAKRARERREDGAPTPDAVVSAEGTQMRGGPAEGVERIDFVDADGDPLTN